MVGPVRGAVGEDLEKRGQLTKLRPFQILKWADAYHARTGKWPTWDSGPIPEAPGETWLGAEAALSLGGRGFPGRSTLIRFLDEHRGRYNPKGAHFTIKQILGWMDEWHARTGRWPDGKSARIPGTEGVKWSAVEYALAKGRGGLPRGSSLARLRAERRGVPRRQDRPGLTEATVLRWADAYYKRTRRWPSQGSGRIRGTPDENWVAVDHALRVGLRGLPGGSSLRQLLSRSAACAMRRTCRRLVSPRFSAGPTPITSGSANGRREAPDPSPMRLVKRGWGSASPSGLAGGACAVARRWPGCWRRGVRNKQSLLPLTVRRILRWADAYHARTGRWPDGRSGPIPEAPGETWRAVESALSRGGRGLPGGSSLVRLLSKSRGDKRRSRRSSRSEGRL